MKINIQWVPFSAPLSYLAVSEITRAVWGTRIPEQFPAEGLYLRTARGGWFARGGQLARIIVLKNGIEVPYTYEATPWELTIRADAGSVSMAFDLHGQLRMAGRGVSLRLELPAGTYDEFLTYSADQWYLAAHRFESKLLFTRISGGVQRLDPGLEARNEEKAVTFSGEEWEGMVEEFCAAYPGRERLESYAACVKRARESFEAYAEKACAGVPERFAEAARQAAYVNYSAQVQGELLEGRVMLMSKNWMNSVWTWDCQFNAVETSGYDPEAAWDNFASPFRRQHETGMLLDMVCDHHYSDTYTKPPVHGWALSHLRRAGILSMEQKRWAYEHLLRWVDSWYTYMDWDHDGVCQYNHGNDSGWDNCTYFLCGAPIEGPELSAYLTICWDELAVLADELGMPEAAEAHRGRADAQLKALIDHSWDGDHFHTYQSGTHNEMDDCDSLLPYLPILLGDRLPRAIFDKMAMDLQEENRFLTPYGLATERVNDRFYVSDGYWRGPIWAPAMMFIICGLARGGATEFAAELSERFCRNCAREGFAENFDATSGAGLRDRAYTWTSSVFLILAKHYVRP